MDKFYPPNFIGYFPLANGKPAAGGYLIVCRTGTDVLAPVYDENGTLIPASRVPIDSAGRAHFLLDPAITYRIKVVPPPDVDPINTAVYDNVRVAECTIVGMTNPMTAEGDMIVGGVDGAPQALPKGTQGYVLIMGATAPNWTAGDEVFVPLSGTKAGFPISGALAFDDGNGAGALSFTNWFSATGSDSSAAIRLEVPKGAFMLSPSGCGIWTYSGTNLNLEGAAGVTVYAHNNDLELKSNSQVVVTGQFKVGSASTDFASYMLAATDFSSLSDLANAQHALMTAPSVKKAVELLNPMTSLGDLVVGGAGGSPARLGVGADYQILTSLNGNIGWAAPATQTGDRKVKLNAADASPSYLADKLVDGDGIKFTNNGTTLTIAFDNPMDGLGQLIYGGVDGALTKLAIGTDGYVLKSRSGVPTWEAESGGMTNPMTAQYDLIVGGVGGAPSRLATSSSMGNILAITSNSGMIGWTSPSLVIPSIANIGKVFAASGDSTPDYLYNKLDAGTGISIANNGTHVTISATGGGSTETCQENYSLLNSSNYYDVSSKVNTLYASKVVANATATRTKLGFFHKSGTTGFVILGVYDNSGARIAATVKTALTSATYEQMCWIDTQASFTLTAGEEYWFAAIFCEDNWQCNINAIGKVIPVAFDANIVGSRSVGAVNNMPSSLGTLTYETQVWYLSAR